MTAQAHGAQQERRSSRPAADAAERDAADDIRPDAAERNAADDIRPDAAEGVAIRGADVSADAGVWALSDTEVIIFSLKVFIGGTLAAAAGRLV